MLRNNKASIISPEKVTTDGWYTFNLNPNMQHHSYNPIKRWNEVYKDIQQTITAFVEEAEIEGNLEISRKGRIHMHGYIRFKKVAEFYLKLTSHLIDNHIEIDTIEDMAVWDEYVTKQELILKNFKCKIKQDKMVLIKNQFGALL